MVESNTRSTIPYNVRGNLVSILQFEVEKFNYDSLKVKEENVRDIKNVESGNIMFKDLNRTNIVINGTIVNSTAEVEEDKQESLVSKSMEEVDNALDLLYELDYGSENYRPYLVRVFKEVFQHARAEIPNDSIIQEFITNCNQCGYARAMIPVLYNSFPKCNMVPAIINTVYINCNNSNHVDVKINVKSTIRDCQYPTKEGIASISALLEFNLESKGDEVKYTNGKLSLTLPKELEQDKDLLTKIIEWLKKIFGIEIKGPVIEHSFDDAKVEKSQTKLEKEAVKTIQAHETRGL